MTNSCRKNSASNGFEILIQGTVQGVGFRPFVYNLARRLKIAGSVANTGDGVRIRAMARDQDSLDAFLAALRHEAPPLAVITGLRHQPLHQPLVDDGFVILASSTGQGARTALPPDIALCDDCLRELFDPADHRFRYPFINCTNCGPRFSIVESIPYDRRHTSMKSFAMCPTCTAQYQDPGDRRFHAQPNACADCGPGLFWHDPGGGEGATITPLTGAAAALAADQVVAIRGLGGFHLAVNAHSSTAVRLLRRRKGRPDKPLAVMMPDLQVIRRHCLVSEKEEELLRSPVHPIVLLKKNRPFSLADELVFTIGELGVMLPYTPFQQLLFAEPGCPDVLVMTSGNAAGAPICTANDDAITRLSPLADAFLLHDREIVTRVDDSVARIVADRPQIFRRARGYVPAPLTVPWPLPAVLGVGGSQKNTFCLGRETSLYLSQHIGDLVDLESSEFFLESLAHFHRVFQIEPEICCCDLHPDYLSSRYGAQLGIPLYRIQHHHAHAVAVMAEHGLDGPVLAVVLDGTGYGPDGTVWGGEILLTEYTDSTRLAHLEQLPLPGGDSCASEPWRMGLAALFAAHDHRPWPENTLPGALKAIDARKRRVVNSMLTAQFNSPLTSSCGRLFDAVAAILAVRQQLSYEGQGASELEALARTAATATWYREIDTVSQRRSLRPWGEKDGKLEIYSTQFVKMVLTALDQGRTRAETALYFHCLLIGALAGLLVELAESTGIRQVALAGGCIQNSLLLEGLRHTLAADGLQIFTGEKLPVNDGAISFGQAVTGGLRHVSCNSHAGHQCSG
ncbi:MAG: carbamoyltransferase HypF [Desulfopila sp.]